MDIVRCTLCGSEETKLIDTKVRYAEDSSCHAYHCSNCMVDFIYPVTGSNLETYYDGEFRSEIKRNPDPYVDLDREFNEYMEEAVVRLSRIKNQLNRDDEILEIGSYTGYFLYCVCDYVKMAYGTDWDSRARKYVSEKFQNKNICISKNPEDYNKKFDKIFLYHVLEHIENPVKYMQYLKNFIKPGGKIYIEVPNVNDALMTKYDCHEFRDYFYSKVHIFNYSEAALKYIFRQCCLNNYVIDFVQRYDLSYHLYWLRYRKPGGYGYYKETLGSEVNERYAKALIKDKTSDAIMAIVSV